MHRYLSLYGETNLCVYILKHVFIHVFTSGFKHAGLQNVYLFLNAFKFLCPFLEIIEFTTHNKNSSNNYHNNALKHEKLQNKMSSF